MWLGTDEAHQILKKLELMAPGLTTTTDGSGKVVHNGLLQSLIYKIQNANTKRRDKLIVEDQGTKSK